MLLNQCLAVSLSPLVDAPNHQLTDVDQESALKLFQQLVAENRQLSAIPKVAKIQTNQQLQKLEDISTQNTHKTSTEHEQDSFADGSIERLELAGYVSPNWLLVSGPLADLEHLTRRWSAGLLIAPPGSRLETVGRIRSVSIDYLEISSSRQYQLDSLVLDAISNLSSQTAEPIHVGQLLEHLEPKVGQSSLVGPLDRVINDLVRNNQVRMLPMTQQQVAEVLTKHHGKRGVAQSVFLDKLLERRDAKDVTAGASSKLITSGDLSHLLDRSVPSRSARGYDGHEETNKSRNHLSSSSKGFWRSRSLKAPTRNRLALDKHLEASVDCLSGSGDRKHDTPTTRLGFFFRRLFSIRLSRQNTHHNVDISQLDRSNSPALVMTPIQRPLIPIAAKSSSSSSSMDSSSTSSLVETLDCLFKEEYSYSSAQVNDTSNTSQLRNSTASLCTTKSSASQQLRRHLDEASRRYRVCTNQRERDFIDSINVLRHASRHADQNSSSSSKNKRTKLTNNGEETDSGSSSGCCTSPPSECFNLKPIDYLPGGALSSRYQPIDCTSEDCCFSAQPGSLELVTPNPFCPIWRSLLASYWSTERPCYLS